MDNDSAIMQAIGRQFVSSPCSASNSSPSARTTAPLDEYAPAYVRHEGRVGHVMAQWPGFSSIRTLTPELQRDLRS